MGIDPMTLQAATTIYKNRRAAAYLVQPMRRYGRLGLADAGDAGVVESGSQDSLSASILNALEGFDRHGASEPRPHSREEQARFTKVHDAVMVTRYLDGRLETTPYEHFQGGFKAMSEAAIVLPPPLSVGSLLAAVEEAFARASRS